MRLILCVVVLLLIERCYAPPVTPDKSKEQDSETKDDLEDYMEYHRYLKEVVQALESDSEFRERLEKADQEDVRSGKVAEQLDFVNHNVRSKLNEIKRRELVRLRHLATKQYELSNNLDVDSVHSPSHEHLDNKNLHTFEIEDLKKLIKKTTSDLEEIDKRRKQEFKEYEMQKEFEKHQKLESLDEQHKKEYQERLEQDEKVKKEHRPLHHPVTKEQLLELWKNVDQLETKDFNPRVFFMMHDVDGNGVWDADEVKALFIKELDKLYGPNGPNKDLHERAEEMERMREHVFLESDLNRDGLIDFNEFMMQTRRSDFQQDQGWQPIDENQIYTKDEYHEYEKRRMEELRYLQERGLIDAHGRPIPGAHHQLNQAYQQNYQNQYPVPGQIPVSQQQYYQQGQMQVPGQPHAQGYPQGQVPMQGQMPVHGQVQGQMPVHGQVQGQMPVHEQVHGQIPVQSQVPGQRQVQGQVPVQGQGQNQIPVQGQGQGQNQIPIQGQGQNQIPVQGQAQGQIPLQGHKQNEAPVPGPTTYAKVPVLGQAESQLPAAGQAHV